MKTAEQEKLEGYPGHRKPQDNPPVKDINIPNPPKFLSRTGKRAYHDLVAIVGPEGMQVMGKSDSLALTMICDAYADYREAKAILVKYGRFIEQIDFVKTGKTDKDGLEIIKRVVKNVKVNSAAKDASESWKRVMQGLSKFGMTPYDRKNVNALKSIATEETRPEKKKRLRAEALIKANKAKELAGEGNHIKDVVNV